MGSPRRDRLLPFRSSRVFSLFSFLSERLLPREASRSLEEPLGLRVLCLWEEDLGGGTGGVPSMSGYWRAFFGAEEVA